MRLHSARGVALLLAIVLVNLGVVPCACAEMSMPPDSSAGHCGAAGSGLRAKVEACSCACMTAPDEDSARVRVEPVPVRSPSVAPGAHALVPGSSRLDPPIPRRRIGNSPPSVPPILRI